MELVKGGAVGVPNEEGTLCDYFAVIGLDQTGEPMVDRYAESICELASTSGGEPALRSPLERPYEARVLMHFPRRRACVPFPPEISTLALPRGVYFHTRRRAPKLPTYHSFIVTKEDGTRVNGSALTYYEEVSDLRIRQYLYDHQMAYVNKLAATSNGDTKLAPAVCDGDGSPRKTPTRSASHHRRASHASAMGTRRAKKETDYYDSVDKPLFASKCLCLVTQIPVVFSSEAILRYLWRVLNSEAQIATTIESAIYWMLHEIPLPSPGTCLRVCHDSCRVLVRRPDSTQLPFFDYPIQNAFTFVSVDKFLRLFTCFMLERQILLCSRHLDRLMLIAESLSALLFPFRWQLTYVPVLPYCQLGFLEAPFNFLIGLCYEDELPEQIFQANACILDIDSGRLDYPEDVPCFPKQKEMAAAILRLLQSHCNGAEGANDGVAHSSVPMRRGRRTSKDPAPPSASSSSKHHRSSRRPSAVHDAGELWSTKRMSRSYDNSLSLEREETKSEECRGTSEGRGVDTTRIYQRGLHFNDAIRELFVQHFTTLFCSYQHFLLHSATSGDGAEESRSEGRESVPNFDKVSFLSEQPGSHLLFLAAFLETQIFTSFIDAKIISHCTQSDREAVDYFDARISRLATATTNDYSFLNCDSAVWDAGEEAEQQCGDYDVPPPRPAHGAAGNGLNYKGVFPSYLDPGALEAASVGGAGGGSVLCSPWKQPLPENRGVLDVLEGAATRLASRDATPVATALTPLNQTPMKVSQQNWKFVEQLLKETKTKTKRLLVSKMGKEAMHLGHGDLGITGVEENTLVAGLCDLVERIWAHGLKNKSGASPLWSTLYAHHDKEKTGSASLADQFNVKSSATAADGVRDECEPNESNSSAGEEESSKLLDTLLDSIRNIAKSFEETETATGDGREAEKRVTIEKRAHSKDASHGRRRAATHHIIPDSHDDDTSGHWSQPLVKAANFIYDRLNNNPTTAVPTTENGNGSHRVYPTTEEPPQRRTDPAESRPKRDGSVARFYHHEDRAVKEKLASIAHRPTSRSRKKTTRTLSNGNAAADVKPPPGKTSPAVVVQPTTPTPASLDFAPNWSSHALSVAASSSIDESAGDASKQLSRTLLPPQSARSELGSLHEVPSASGRRSQSRPHSPMTPQHRPRHRDTGYRRGLLPLPTGMAYDLRNVMRMTEIRTDNGFARAFLRLALERKLLHKHFKSLFANHRLLQKIYKRHAFLRCEEEREQFLFHVLSLNAVDFSCFTHTFISAKMRYEVLVVCGIDSYFSSSLWIMLTGSLGSTTAIYLPPDSLQFTFDYKNLGLLSTIRIGYATNRVQHAPSKLFLDFVLVRNNITGRTFHFNCGRWFGRGVDDGALERLLVAEVQTGSVSTDGDGNGMGVGVRGDEPGGSMNASQYGHGGLFGRGIVSRPESPVSSVLTSPRRSNFYSTGSLTRRRRSPSVGRSMEYIFAKQNVPQLTELQHRIGMCVNALVKHFLTDKDHMESAARLTPLLCGDEGLVPCMEQVFEMGRQDTLFSNRFFRQPYPWDYVERVFSWFFNFFRNGESRKLTKDQRSLIIYSYNLVRKIGANTAVGKEGRFSVFILLTLRDHILPGLLPLMAWTPVTAQMYDDSAILKQPHHLSYLSKLLGSLNEFNFTLEKSLTLGIENI